MFTWVSEFMPEAEARTRVSVSLEPAGSGQTRLVLVHDQLPEGGGYDDHPQGWASILDKLALRLEPAGSRRRRSGT